MRREANAQRTNYVTDIAIMLIMLGIVCLVWIIAVFAVECARARAALQRDGEAPAEQFSTIYGTKKPIDRRTTNANLSNGSE